MFRFSCYPFLCVPNRNIKLIIKSWDFFFILFLINFWYEMMRLIIIRSNKWNKKRALKRKKWKISDVLWPRENQRKFSISNCWRFFSSLHRSALVNNNIKNKWIYVLFDAFSLDFIRCDDACGEHVCIWIHREGELISKKLC